jgi:hypothetical protein
VIKFAKALFATLVSGGVGYAAALEASRTPYGGLMVFLGLVAIGCLIGFAVAGTKLLDDVVAS